MNTYASIKEILGEDALWSEAHLCDLPRWVAEAGEVSFEIIPGLCACISFIEPRATVLHLLDYFIQDMTETMLFLDAADRFVVSHPGYLYVDRIREITFRFERIESDIASVNFVTVELP